MQVHYLICYDIADEKRLRKVAKIMEDYGERVLYSVFECLLAPWELEELRDKVESILVPEEDNVIYYVICEKCEKKIEHMGRTKTLLEKKEFEIL